MGHNKHTAIPENRGGLINTGLICPNCGTDKSKVTDSRGSKNSEYKRRRRSCHNCSHRFTTFEIREQDYKVQLEEIKKLQKEVSKHRRISDLINKAVEIALEGIYEK